VQRSRAAREADGKASQLRYLGAADRDDPLIAQIAALAPDAGDGDHRHIAYAVSGGADYLITRDGALLRARKAIAAEVGIEVIRPEQLIADLDRARRHGLYEPVALQGTELTESRLPGNGQDEFTGALLNHGAGERAADFRTLLRESLADPTEREVLSISERGGAIVGGVIRQEDDGQLLVRLLRVPGLGSLPRAIARQLASSQRAEAARRGLSSVVVEDPRPSSLTSVSRVESSLSTRLSSTSRRSSMWSSTVSLSRLTLSFNRSSMLGKTTLCRSE